MVCPHERGRGFDPMRIFFGQGGGSILRDFVWTSFVDGPYAHL